ncbi:hypothetical protein D4764_04G0006890 [Takifugu flavidus]|uniref:Uncharacterized protein n=1 Tax=Takifugu flavidus TaxID=433684 RepID=A0A5C6N3F5_9TELE|nr:hypothetical protein D4764_04G0006890 [Takifugu flavidus]
MAGEGDVRASRLVIRVAFMAGSGLWENVNRNAAFECISSALTQQSYADSKPKTLSELLSIQQDMESYQQDRKQLRAWKKLKAVLQSWKQTSGRYDQSEKAAVCQEMKELEERIARLSAELAKEKPRILLHAERIQHLQTVLRRHSVLTASH